MTQDERWELHFEQVMQFMRTQRRCPSKHRLEEHRMLNWIKFNKKQLAKGKMPPSRLQHFQQLLQTADRYQRLNQYAYLHTFNE